MNEIHYINRVEYCEVRELAAMTVVKKTICLGSTGRKLYPVTHGRTGFGRSQQQNREQTACFRI